MPDHFLDNMEDWSLEAVIRDYSGGDHRSPMIRDSNNGGHNLLMGFSGMHQEFSTRGSGDISDKAVHLSDELEQLYKPFYPALDLACVESGGEFHEKQPENDAGDKSAGGSDRSWGTSCLAKVTHEAYTPKYKKRKNQQKRVMVQVSANDLGSDMWAWRKYGQKPIKGSPYPRSYYRCSSSKGCLARKQVEQSCTDPGMFIITYTAEHSHSQPTRRNSLAGTVRQKFPVHKNPNHAPEQGTDSDKSFQSPTGDIFVPRKTMKQEIQEEDNFFPAFVDGCNGDDCNELATPSSMCDDEFFSGLDFLDELVWECRVR